MSMVNFDPSWNSFIRLLVQASELPACLRCVRLGAHLLLLLLSLTLLKLDLELLLLFQQLLHEL